MTLIKDDPSFRGGSEIWLWWQGGIKCLVSCEFGKRRNAAELPPATTLKVEIPAYGICSLQHLKHPHCLCESNSMARWARPASTLTITLLVSFFVILGLFGPGKGIHRFRAVYEHRQQIIKEKGSHWAEHDGIKSKWPLVQIQGLVLPSTAAADRKAVVDIFTKSYEHYKALAYGHDDARPISGTYVDTRNGQWTWNPKATLKLIFDDQDGEQP